LGHSAKDGERKIKERSAALARQFSGYAATI